MADLFSGMPEKGPRFEKAVAKAASDWNVKGASHELAGHVHSSYRFLLAWLTHNGWHSSPAHVRVEKSYAIEVATGRVREIAAPSAEDHVYADLLEGEIAATADLETTSIDGKRTLMLDHKTGYVDTGFVEPARLPQMKTLGLIPFDLHPKKQHVLAIFHADRQGMPNVHWDEYPAQEADDHRAALGRALSRIGDGSLRPSKECERCPAASTCPARSADILSATSAAMVSAGIERLSTANGNWDTLTNEERAGRLYVMLRALKQLDEAGREEIKRMVQAGAIVELPSGEVLTISSEEYEGLSKASIVRALGKLEGERLIASLRKKGVVEKSKRERLLPKRA